MIVDKVLLDALRPYLQRAMTSSADRVSSEFGKAVRSIYGSKENGTPMHIGSSVLLQLDGARYVVTAAHVLDHSEYTTLYIGGDVELIPLVGIDFNATRAPNGRRNLDQLDFAFAQLSTAISEKLVGAKFVQEHEIDSGIPPGRGHYYTFLGYPNSRNGEFDNAKKKTRVQQWSFSGNAVRHAKLADGLPGKGTNHIFVKFEKWGREDNGTRVRNLKPRGMSGGAVVRGCDLANPKEVLLGSSVSPKLAALLIERDRKYSHLISVHMGIVVAAIRAGFPEKP